VEKLCSNSFWGKKYRLQALITASADVIYCMNPDWSEMWQLISGPIISDTIEPTKKWLDRYIDPSDQPDLINLISRCLGSKKTFQFEHRIIRSDRELAWLSASAVPLINSQGDVIEWVVSAIDVTNNKKSLDELTKKNSSLERDKKELAELAKNLMLNQHHENRQVAKDIHNNLQQLLAVALIKTQLLISSNPTVNVAEIEILRQTLNEAIHISRGITQSLVGTTSLSTELPKALGYLLDEIKKQVGLEVCTEIPDEIGFIPELIGIILYVTTKEILINIARYSSQSDAILKLGVNNQNISLVIQVAGINTDYCLSIKRNINSRWYRNIEKQLKLIEGNIWIDWEMNNQTNICINIPRKVDSQTELKRQKYNKIENTDFFKKKYQKNNNNCINILIADDHIAVREAISDILSKKEDINVIAKCQNGLEALEKSSEIYPDLIIMDINMPIMDGIQATQHIKTNFPQIKVIGLSAYSDSEEGRQMNAAGADLLLSKTVLPEKLIDEVYNCALIDGQD